MIRKPLVALAVFATALVLLPAVAGAHVEIESEGPPASDGAVAATVVAENECPDNGTLTNVELSFPATPELTAVSAEPIDGWTAVVTKKTGSEAVEKIVWTNTATVEGDGTFPISIGPVDADVEEVDFKALDTCSNGEVTRWVEEGEDSEHPAPVLAITAVKATDDGTSTTTKAADSDEDDDSNTGLIVGIVIAVVVVGGGIAFAVSRKKS